MSASSRGLRLSAGPRIARVHVGAGRPGLSTGIGPVTYYTSLGGRSGGDSRSTAVSTSTAAVSRQLRGSAKAQAVAELQAVVAAILDLHRQEFPPAQPPVVAPPAVPVLDVVVQQREEEAVRDLGFFQFGAKREAREAARAAALEEHRRLVADGEAWRARTQADQDRTWARLLANEPDVVMGFVNWAFRDNEAAAVAVGVEDDEVTLVVQVPGLDVVPDRIPGVTPAGNPSLRKAPKKDVNGLYASLVAGYLLATVKEAFAAAPIIGRARIVALRQSPPDAYGDSHTEVLAAAVVRRSCLAGIRWAEASAAQVLNDAADELLLDQRGAAQELHPLDLTEHPDLAEVVQRVDLSGWLDEPDDRPDE